MNDDFPLRHIILYAKGHYYRSDVSKDLLKICKKLNPKASTTKHVIQIISDVVWGAILENEYTYFEIGKGNLEHRDKDEYRDQWAFMASLRNKFSVNWLNHPEFHKLSFEAQKELERIFQEEFDNRILEAFMSPLIGWKPTIDLGDADGRILPAVSPPKKDKEKDEKEDY